MEDSQPSPEASTDQRVPAHDDPVHEAQRLFARLLAAGPPPHRGASRGAPRPDQAEPVRPHDAGPQSAGAPGALDVARAALAATDRLAELVELTGAHAATTSADLVALASAIESALTATNERLAAVERTVLSGDAPAAGPAEQAMAQLRRRNRRHGGAAGAGRADP